MVPLFFFFENSYLAFVCDFIFQITKFETKDKKFSSIFKGMENILNCAEFYTNT